jgi:hypothetical protein
MVSRCAAHVITVVENNIAAARAFVCLSQCKPILSPPTQETLCKWEGPCSRIQTCASGGDRFITSSHNSCMFADAVSFYPDLD